MPKTETHKITKALLPLKRPLNSFTLLEGNPRDNDVQKIAKLLERFGQLIPIVYKTKKIDGKNTKVIYSGNHRLMAAQLLGWTHIAATPADDLSEEELEAFSIADNKISDDGTYDDELLLSFLDRIASYGDDDDLLGATGYGELDIAELRYGNEDPNPDDDGPDDNYSRKVKSPVYQPTRETPPAISELYDTSKTTGLVERIEQAREREELGADQYNFLMSAAERHTKFNFENIAEYYAHADAPMQLLMEDSLLVIIDFAKAIEKGFVKLTAAIDAAQRADYEEQL